MKINKRRLSSIFLFLGRGRPDDLTAEVKCLAHGVSFDRR